ncbi:hypothetical protein EV175_004068 [Coemansia sp. RSA 1933]|nr:hypothetical protein EV175_004068 [Coemansia sp. RSA 1933]
MTEFARFATAITRTPLFQLEFAACYGVLVKTLDLSNVGGRENNVNHAMVAHVLTFCPNLECIDLSLCRNISDAQFIRLFADNPHISRKLKSLNLDKISIGDEAMGQTVCLLPNLIHLRLSETNAGPLTCIAIGSCLFDLRSLGIASCDLIDDSCLVAVAKGCKKLRHIKIKGCSNIQTDDAEDLMALHRCFPYVSDGSDNEYDDDTGTIIDDIANDPLLHMFFGNGEHSVRSINELVYSAMDTSD